MSERLLRFLRNNLIALLALFIALGGTSYAAGAIKANSVGTKQLKNGAVTAKKIKAGAVGTTALADGAVTGAKVVASSLGKVPSAASADTAGDSAKWGGVSGGALGTTVVVPGMLFRPTLPGVTWSLEGSGIYVSAAATLAARVVLPQGASVTRLTEYYTRTGTGTAGEVDLAKANTEAGAINVLTIPSTSVSGSGSLSATPGAAIAVDTAKYGYYVQWTSPGSASTLNSVKVEYTLP